jgi:hypothetical protein
VKSDVDNLKLPNTIFDCIEADSINFETKFLVNVSVNYSVYAFYRYTVTVRAG